MSVNKQRIIVRSLPYQGNKAKLIENIAHLVREKRIEGIYEIRDESDRQEIKIWSVETMECVETIKSEKGNIVSLAFIQMK